MPRAIKSEGIYRKKGSKIYHMCIRIDGKVVVNRSTRMRTKPAALEVYNRERERLVQESLGIFTSKTPRDAHKEWETFARSHYGTKYIQATKDYLDRFWSSLMDTPFSLIRQEQVHKIHLAIQEHGFKPETFNKIINAFSCLVTFARDELGWLKFVNFKFKRQEVEPTRKRGLTKKEVPVFLKLVAVQSSIHALMLIAMMLGLAIREIEALYACWSKFSYSPEGHLTFATLGKNGKERVVTVPDWLEVMVRRYQEIILSPDYRASRRRGRRRTDQPVPANSGTASSPQNDWMFPNGNGTPYWSGFTATYIKKAAAQMGIDTLSPHRLRGSSANLLKLEGLTLDEIQRLLGHTHITTTALYLEQNLSITRDAQNALGNQLWPGASTAVRELRLKQSNSPQTSLLPLPPEVAEKNLAQIVEVDTPGMRLLPISVVVPAPDLQPSPEDPEALRKAISSSIQEISLQPQRGRPPKSLLAKLVWDLPTSRIAEIYGVSDTAVGKWCDEEDIEKPGRGYWAKVQSLTKALRQESR
jgi:integrase